MSIIALRSILPSKSPLGGEFRYHLNRPYNVSSKMPSAIAMQFYATKVNSKPNKGQKHKDLPLTSNYAQNNNNYKTRRHKTEPKEQIQLSSQKKTKETAKNPKESAEKIEKKEKVETKETSNKEAGDQKQEENDANSSPSKTKEPVVIPDPPNDVVQATRMLNQFLRKSNFDTADVFFEKMKAQDMHKNAFVINAMLKCYGIKNELGKMMDLYQILKTEKITELRPYITLLNYLGRRDPPKMMTVFEEIQANPSIKMNENAYFMVITRMCNVDLEGAIELYEDMKMSGIQPTAEVYITLLNALGKSNMLEKLKQVYEDMKGSKIKPNALMLATVVKYFGEVEAKLYFGAKDFYRMSHINSLRKDKGHISRVSKRKST